MGPLDLFRAQRPKAVDAARDAASGDYAERFEVLTGLVADSTIGSKLAKDAARGAYIAHNAGEAEEQNPEPRANLRQSFCCIPCHVYYIAAAQNAR